MNSLNIFRPPRKEMFLCSVQYFQILKINNFIHESQCLIILILSSDSGLFFSSFKFSFENIDNSVSVLSHK